MVFATGKIFFVRNLWKKRIIKVYSLPKWGKQSVISEKRVYQVKPKSKKL